jgi:glucose-6-phosphate isomerase
MRTKLSQRRGNTGIKRRNGNNNKGVKMLKVEFKNMLAERVGPRNGISRTAIDKMQPQIDRALDEVDKLRKGDDVAFFHLPFKREHVDKIEQLADSTAKNFDNYVLLGIGGSSLGPIAVQNALKDPMWNLLPPSKRDSRPRMFFLDNIEPDMIASISRFINPKKTLFNVISKSGSTAETMSQFMIFRQQLIRAVGKEKASSHIIATTDPENGLMREIVNQEGYESLEVPAGIGGRFSVLSPVGLFPAAVSGVNITKLLDGAASITKKCKGANVWRNPAMLIASMLYLADTKKNKPIHVMMPYSNRLYSIADWYRQLWAESLGKRLSGRKVVNTGPTTVKALGATDQHSQSQLYVEGPADKVIIFIRVENFDSTVKIPRGFAGKPGLSYLSGHTLNELIDAEQKATEVTLAKNKRPSITITLPEISEETIGALFYMFEMATAYAGQFYSINAYNQPGVEEGKQFAYGIMGRPGYEHKAREFKQLRGQQKISSHF